MAQFPFTSHQSPWMELCCPIYFFFFFLNSFSAQKLKHVSGWRITGNKKCAYFTALKETNCAVRYLQRRCRGSILWAPISKLTEHWGAAQCYQLCYQHSPLHKPPWRNMLISFILHQMFVANGFQIFSYFFFFLIALFIIIPFHYALKEMKCSPCSRKVHSSVLSIIDRSLSNQWFILFKNPDLSP